MADLPIVITSAGPLPRDVEEIRNTLLTIVAATNPGYTANLPGILIEDISSTDVYAISECDSARVETVNSLTPLGANEFLLLQLGQMLGIPIGSASNTSVFVVFDAFIPGVVIGKGFIVTDGTYQYAVSTGGITKAGGSTDPLFAVAIESGTWAVPAGTVNQLVTSSPPGLFVTVVNPGPGIPGSDADLSDTAYRAKVLQANLAASQGMARYLRTLLAQVPGVQSRLVLPLMNPVVGQEGWQMIVGGGDPYQVAYAIYTALFDIADIVGSSLDISGITNAIPAVVTTRLNHLLTVDSHIHIADVDPNGFNGDFIVIGVPSEKQFYLGVHFALVSISAATWAATAGGQITFTTSAPHGITVGSTFVVAGMTPTGYNGTYVAIAGTSGTTLKTAQTVDPGAAAAFGQVQPGTALFDSTSLGAYVSGGIITPNPRNLQVSIQDYPDTYSFPIVIPPEQTVTMTVSWNTISPNFVDPSAVAQAVQPAMVTYVNSVFVGKPMSLLELEDAFHDAVADILDITLISVLTFDVSINSVPTAATGLLIYGDPESFFFAVSAGISVVKL